MFAAHVRYRAIEFLRTTWAIVPTVAFPTMIAVFFIIPNTAEQPRAAAYGLVSVLLLSFTMIAMFNFGAGTAEERALPWDGFQRTLPIRPRVALAARVVVGMGFAIVGALPAVVVTTLATVVSVPPARWPMLAAAVLAGAVAMTLLGLALGNALPLKAAVATANVLFLPMGFVGGIFLPLEFLPDWARAVGLATPMRAWVEVSLDAAYGAGVAPGWWAALAGWLLALGGLAAWAYRRDQTQRFR